MIGTIKETYKTKRLELNRLTLSDAAFIFDLFNTERYIKFIGDRNIKSTEDARNFIQKNEENPNINYWVVRLLNTKISVGMISFIKRDYLEYHDLGFAFLPAFSKKGYAFESAEIVLKDRLLDPDHRTILAITMVNNGNSIKLIEKLGFCYNKEIEHENTRISQYSMTAG